MPITAAPANPAAVARIAGALYLGIIVLGIWSELAVRAPLAVPGDPAATVANIRGAEALLRLSLAADTLMAVFDVALAVLLFVLLRPVDALLALVAMAFRLIQAAVIGAALLNQQAALLVLGGGGGGPELAALFLDLQSHGYDLGLIFFGVNSLVTGYLVYRSGFLPRFVGAGVIAAGIVYLIGSYLRILAPGWVDAFAPAYAIPLVAETAFCLWLLLRGVDADRWKRAAGSTGTG
jgi:hypothetical protein